MKIYNKYVPNEIRPGTKILAVGEAPGEVEEMTGRPFMGKSGQLLEDALARVGLMRADLSFANLCNYRPFGNKFENLLGSHQLDDGLQQLRGVVRTLRPRVILALGAWPLQFLTGKRGINVWRGSILEATTDFQQTKVVATYHPANVLREGKNYPAFDLDLRRVKADAEFSDLRLPTYNFRLNPKGYELEESVYDIIDAPIVAVDIETRKGSTEILCVGFAISTTRAIVIANDGSSAYRSAVSRILESPNKKVFHGGISFDLEQLWLNGFEVNNFYWDTMTAQHAMNPELPKTLAFLGSIYTRQPYWKHTGSAEIPKDEKAWSLKTVADRERLYTYNGIDCCVTFEVCEGQQQEISDEERKVFDFEMSEFEVAAHISRSGMLVDEERAKEFEQALYYKWGLLQGLAERVAGVGSFNVRSPKLKNLLYGTLKLPERRKRGRDGEPGPLTTDEDAIVSLLGFVTGKLAELKTDRVRDEWERKLGILKAILQIRGVRQLLSNYIFAERSTDGRLRSTYKVSGPETGRWSASGYVDGTGLNSQTFPRGEVDMMLEARGVVVPAEFKSEIKKEDEDESEGADREAEVA